MGNIIFPAYYTFVAICDEDNITLLSKNASEGVKRFKLYMRHVKNLPQHYEEMFDIYHTDYMFPGRENVKTWSRDTI